MSLLCAILGCKNGNAGGGLCTKHWDGWITSPECNVLANGGYGRGARPLPDRAESARADYVRRVNATLRVEKEMADVSPKAV